ncbi:MAG: phospho-N-acetylmuramoyl-pentapeptide-transferase [Oscillospiraceae bacterium]|jgi:phospho-N-acetylmuramoyl-pentapeptide-transferase|nr:phospho-N-acetylmuramoyl-pentapeptide-transferase [Oscillospiraceae bacterium]
MLSPLLGAAISLAVTVLTALFFVPYMRKKKIGQSIREEGPARHMSKAGTPTAGGALFIAGTALACAAAGWRLFTGGDYSHIVALLSAAAFGAIGFTDDYRKIRGKRNLGLRVLPKLLLQFGAAALLLAALLFFGLVTPNNTWLYCALALPFIVGTVNAVNFTDGLDGLLSGVTLPIACFFAAAAFLAGKGGLSLFAAALAGGLTGFLFFNSHPARVFMGDTGSLFIGGALCCMALISGLEPLLFAVGLVYVLEIASVVLQVAYFKLTGGKRIFKMAPLHHHFELCGWGEVKIVLCASALTALLCAAAWPGVRFCLNV